MESNLKCHMDKSDSFMQEIQKNVYKTQKHLPAMNYWRPFHKGNECFNPLQIKITTRWMNTRMYFQTWLQVGNTDSYSSKGCAIKNTKNFSLLKFVFHYIKVGDFFHSA